jgi:hypothetical protein
MFGREIILVNSRDPYIFLTELDNNDLRYIDPNISDTLLEKGPPLRVFEVSTFNNKGVAVEGYISVALGGMSPCVDNEEIKESVLWYLAMSPEWRHITNDPQ